MTFCWQCWDSIFPLEVYFQDAIVSVFDRLLSCSVNRSAAQSLSRVAPKLILWHDRSIDQTFHSWFACLIACLSGQSTADSVTYSLNRLLIWSLASSIARSIFRPLLRLIAPSHVRSVGSRVSRSLGRSFGRWITEQPSFAPSLAIQETSVSENSSE